jgi:hypothetical protein
VRELYRLAAECIQMAKAVPHAMIDPRYAGLMNALVRDCLLLVGIDLCIPFLSMTPTLKR